MNENNKNKKDLAILIGCIVLLFLGCLGFFSARWYITEFGDTGFDSILYTLFSEMSGTDSAVIRNYMLTALLPALVSFVVLTLLFWAKGAMVKKSILLQKNVHASSLWWFPV